MSRFFKRLGYHPSAAVILIAALMTGSVVPAAVADSNSDPAPSNTDQQLKGGSTIASGSEQPQAAPNGVEETVNMIQGLNDSASAGSKSLQIPSINLVWYDDQRNAVVAYVAAPSSAEFKAEAQKIEQPKPETAGYGLEVIRVSRPLDETKTVQQRIDSDTEYWKSQGVTIATTGITPAGDIIEVTGMAADSKAIQSKMSERYGNGIDFTTVDSLPTNMANRLTDYAPWFQGDTFIPSTGGFCTSGFAVTKPNHGNYMLTAGHCFKNTGNKATYFGYSVGPYMGYVSQLDHQNYYPADAALVTGSYNPHVWTGDGASSDAYLPVTSANLSSTEPSTAVCLDGSNFGQICRDVKVTATNVTATFVNSAGAITGITSGLTTATYTGSGSLCAEGDSGGPVYDGLNQPGSVRARGIIIGGAGQGSSSKTCYYLPWATMAYRLGTKIIGGELKIRTP